MGRLRRTAVQKGGRRVRRGEDHGYTCTFEMKVWGWAGEVWSGAAQE